MWVPVSPVSVYTSFISLLSSKETSYHSIVVKHCTLKIFLWVFLCCPLFAYGEVLFQDTVWEGEILIEEDILIPKGITLTVRQGAVVKVSPASTTRTDPQYMSSLTEITVRGNLHVEGTGEKPVTFKLNPAVEEGDSWAGIIVDGGMVGIRSAAIREAESGIWILGGNVNIQDSQLTANRYGVVAQNDSVGVNIEGTRIDHNDYGLVTLNGAVIHQESTITTDNSKLDMYESLAPVLDLEKKGYSFKVQAQAEELEDEVLLGSTVWQGRVRVTGQVRVPVDSRLVIMPGTIVEFTKKDTNGDGIGESGLMLQGVLIAKGTPRKPILFRSAEPEKNRGDWDAVNIINSDGVRNLIEYCQFEDAYRGLHFHFSNVMIQQSVFRNNYRGIQFQESTVELRDNLFYTNISAVQARDSEIILAGNLVYENIFGGNFLRAHLTIQDNIFAGNLDFGLKVREGFPTLSRNVFHHNRYGLMFSDAAYGSISGNVMAANSETGLSIRSGNNMEIIGNFIQGNGLSGISVRETAAVIRNNHISGNGERGIGVISFVGPITYNTIVDNKLYAIAVEDDSNVSAPDNWFGRTDMEPIIFDRADDPRRGDVQYQPLLEKPEPVAWPLVKLPLHFKWSGTVRVPETVNVPAGVTLSVMPDTTVLFAKNAGLYIRGNIDATGTPENRIQFTADTGTEPGSWGEIRIEHSETSRFANCDFTYGAWAIHSHFNALSVTGCTFRKNEGGIRFRSGPHRIQNSLFEDNRIGLRAFRGKAEISSNIITNNDKGIFVREKGGGLAIHRNNIFANRDYNIWIGDFNTEDVQATENWWGTDDPTETIFDARREPGIGTVVFEPVLPEALGIEIVDQGE